MPFPLASLDDWDYDIVKALARGANHEADWFDFKAGLPDADTVTKLACAFANGAGGFMILGVGGDGQRWSLDGVEPSTELAADFGRKLRAEPSIMIDGPKSVAIPNSGRVLYVIHVPPSGAGPHLPLAKERRFFWKRTVAGCEQMSWTEIRAAYVERERIRGALQLAAHEIAENLQVLARFRYGPDHYRFEPEAIEVIAFNQAVAQLVDYLRADPHLQRHLSDLRRAYNQANLRTQLFINRASAGDERALADEYANIMRGMLSRIGASSTHALLQLRDKHGVTVSESALKVEY